MSTARKPASPSPLGQLLLAPSSPFQRYRWLVLAVAVVLEGAVVAVVDWADSTLHPLDPVGAGVVFISVVAAGLSGVAVGLAAALAGVLASFLLLADFGTAIAAANAAASALIWCGAAVVTGLVVGTLRGQVARREAALEQALAHSVATRETMGHVLDFSPRFHKSNTLTDAARAICETACSTFGADSSRVFALRGRRLELLAVASHSAEAASDTGRASSAPSRLGDKDRATTGLTISTTALPDLKELLQGLRPSFVRDVRLLRLEQEARDFSFEKDVVSAIRLPVVDPTGVVGVLSLGWNHAVERPTPDLLAIMRRFADQAAIAWEHALQAEAQRRAESLHQVLQKVITFAPTFHIKGSSEEVARAVCEAALASFDCSAAALYRLELDRLHLLARVPAHPALTPGTTFQITPEMAMARELRSRAPTFIPDVNDPSRDPRPWPAEIVRAAGNHSALYVPLRFTERGPRNLLILGWDQPQAAPDQRFLVVVQRFADQAALALTNASAERLHARLEASLLPPVPFAHPSLHVVTKYVPGEQRLRLGGDFVGLLPSADGGLDFIIGDVSGHGPDAAALGATLRSSWKTLTLASQPVASLANVMCRMLLSERRDPNVFATVVAGSIRPDLRSLSLVNAGHPPPFLLTEEVRSLEVPPCLPLGPDETCSWPVHDFVLPDSWRLFFYTDGLLDAHAFPGSQDRFGEKRLREWLTRLGDCPLDQETVDALLREVETANGGPFADDVAVLAISPKD